MKRALFTLIAWLALVPSASAIPFQVTGGYLERNGLNTSSWELFLFGEGFSVRAGGNVAGCRSIVLVGRPITPCGGGALPGFMTFIGGGSPWASFVLGGVEQPPLTFDALFHVLGGSMFVSGATHAVLSAPVSYAGYMSACPLIPVCLPPMPNYEFYLNGLAGSFGMELLLAENGEHYEILRETYTFGRPVPEPGTMALMALGLTSLVAYRRRFKTKRLS